MKCCMLHSQNAAMPVPEDICAYSAAGCYRRHRWFRDCNCISKFSDGNTLANSVLYESSGNVGIGTTAPARALQINDVMRLQPRATAPSSPAAGDIYADSTPASTELCFYDGEAWQGIRQERMPTALSSLQASLKPLCFQPCGC